MTAKIITSREFNQDVGKAKKAAHRGPVFITDRGRVAHVLLTVDEYQKITDQQNIIDRIAMQSQADFEFDPPKLSGALITPAALD